MRNILSAILLGLLILPAGNAFALECGWVAIAHTGSVISSTDGMPKWCSRNVPDKITTTGVNKGEWFYANSHITLQYELKKNPNLTKEQQDAITQSSLTSRDLRNGEHDIVVDAFASRPELCRYLGSTNTVKTSDGNPNQGILVPFKTVSEFTSYLDKDTTATPNTTAIPCAPEIKGAVMTTQCGSTTFDWVRGRQNDTQVAATDFERSREWKWTYLKNGACVEDTSVTHITTTCKASPSWSITTTNHTGAKPSLSTSTWNPVNMPDVDCDPEKPGTLVDAACGASAGGTFNSAPATGLCVTGSIASPVSSATSQYTWTCSASGHDTNCAANKLDGVCGPADGKTFSVAPSGSDLCSKGTASAVSDTANKFTWTCNAAGKNASCSADKVSKVTLSMGYKGCTTQKADFALILDASMSMEMELQSAKEALRTILKDKDFANVHMSIVSVGGTSPSNGGKGHYDDNGKQPDIRDRSCVNDGQPTYTYSYNRNGQLIIVSETPSKRVLMNQNYGHLAAMKNWDASDLKNGGTLDTRIDNLDNAPLTPIGKSLEFTWLEDLQSTGRQHALVLLSDGMETCYTGDQVDRVIKKIQNDDVSVFGIRYTGNGSSWDTFNTMDKHVDVDVTKGQTTQAKQTSDIIDALRGFMQNITTCSMTLKIYDANGDQVAKLRPTANKDDTANLVPGKYKFEFNLCNQKYTDNNVQVTVDATVKQPRDNNNNVILTCPP